MSNQSNHKDSPKGCSCPQCQRGKHHPYGQHLRKLGNRLQRHTAKQLLKRATDYDNLLIPSIRISFTD